MNYKIKTYGCQMNVHESEKIAAILMKFGYETESDDYDIIVFNTCCIRDNAEKKILGHIGAVKKFKEKKPSAKVVIMGCMTQQKGMAETLMRRFPFINLILGANKIQALEEWLSNEPERQHIISVDTNEKPPIYEFEEPYRTSGVNAWVNIMYGCNNFCSYCIVPYVRGRERSRSPEAILNEIERLIKRGYREITLLGQNVDSYGSDFESDIDYDFPRLLSDIDKIEGDYRLRFMTSHPKDIDERVIDAIKNSLHITPYIHLPMQSGSDSVLKAMNRHYDMERYFNIVDMIREKLPNAGITTDIMVGFPGETEEDFLDTLKAVERIRFSAAFTYIYSPRRGTPAAEMEQIPDNIKRSRIARLIEKQNEITRELSREYEGKTYRVLIEDNISGEECCGRTDFGRLVNFKADKQSVGKFAEVIIKRSESASLFGDIVRIL